MNGTPHYVCGTALEQGYAACGTNAVNASTLEDAVVSQVREFAGRPEMVSRVAEVIGAVREEEIRRENVQLGVLKERLTAERRRMYANQGNSTVAEAVVAKAEKAVEEKQGQIDALSTMDFSRGEMVVDVRRFGELWEALTQEEREDMIRLVVSDVTYDGATGVAHIQMKEAANG